MVRICAMFEKAKRYEEMKNFCQSLFEKGIQNRLMSTALSSTFSKNKEVKEGIIYFENMIYQGKIKVAQAYFSLAMLLFEDGSFEEAIENMKKFRTDMTDEIAYDILGHSFVGIPRLDLAEICYKKVLELNPNNQKAIGQLGSIFSMTEGKKDEGREMLQKAV